MDYIVVHCTIESHISSIDTIIVVANSACEAHEIYVRYALLMGMSQKQLDEDFEEGNIRIRPINKLVRI